VGSLGASEGGEGSSQQFFHKPYFACRDGGRARTNALVSGSEFESKTSLYTSKTIHSRFSSTLFCVALAAPSMRMAPGATSRPHRLHGHLGHICLRPPPGQMPSVAGHSTVGRPLCLPTAARPMAPKAHSSGRNFYSRTGLLIRKLLSFLETTSRGRGAE